MFTEFGLKLIEEAHEYGLSEYYDEYNGVFSFTEESMKANMDKILLWLENHDESNGDFVLLYQDFDYYENGCKWFLTSNH